MNNERISLIRNIALFVFVLCAFLWVAFRLPYNIVNIYQWVEIGLLVSGAVLAVLYVVTRKE